MNLFNSLASRKTSRSHGSVSSKVGARRLEVETLEQRSLLDAAGFVRGMYTTLLHRHGSEPEVNGWVALINSGVSQSAVTHVFVNSDERFGTTVKEDYSSLLGREADNVGLNHFVAAMRAGATNEQVRAEMLVSNEYFQKHGSDNKNLVDTLYRDLLKRDADQGGEAHWLAVLNSTNSRAAVVSGLMENTERHRIEVQENYNDVLNRNPDNLGEQSWVTSLDHGMKERDLIERLAGSQEFNDDHGHDLD